MNLSFMASNSVLQMTSNPFVLTSGMQDVVTCTVAFGSEWDGLDKSVSFYSARDGALLSKIVLSPDAWDENTVTVPPEVLAHKADAVFFGVCGASADGVVLPTIWCRLGAVQCGCDLYGDNTHTTPEAWAQLIASVGNLDELDTPSKDNLVAAINDAYNNGGSSTPEIYWAVYGETTSAELKTAYLAGKLIFCRYSTFEYELTKVNNEENPASFTFICPFLPDANRLLCTASGWAEVAVSVELSSNKVTSLSAESTDTQYPSAKCVYDAINAAIGDAIGGAY